MHFLLVENAFLKTEKIKKIFPRTLSSFAISVLSSCQMYKVSVYEKQNDISVYYYCKLQNMDITFYVLLPYIIYVMQSRCFSQSPAFLLQTAKERDKKYIVKSP